MKKEKVFKIMVITGVMGYIISLNSAEPGACKASASIMVPCPSGAHCHCEVRNVNSGVCQEITCSGGRAGCKCYGYCFLIPQTSVCCCGDMPERGEGTGSGEINFEKIYLLKHKNIKISMEKDVFKESKLDSPFYFYSLKDPYKKLFVGVDPANYLLYINLNSRNILKRNVGFWFKFLPERNCLFYMTKKSPRDTILGIYIFDINSLEDKFLTNVREDIFLLSSPFNVYGNKIILKNENKIEIYDFLSGKKIKEFSFHPTLNIEVRYVWQNTGWFLGYSGNYLYLFFNSLPYVIVMDTLLNLIRAYDFYEYDGIEETFLDIEKEYWDIIKRGESDCTTFSISECFTISPNKMIWIFGHLCILFDDGKPLKQLVFKLGENSMNEINAVPFYVSEISFNKILLNFGNQNFAYVDKEKL